MAVQHEVDREDHWQPAGAEPEAADGVTGEQTEAGVVVEHAEAVRVAPHGLGQV